ncbi:MAG: APC family permease [Alcaligenaceae bacterium]|nr:MAG: APC family permease [Alcaligenaceae bacterium]
MVIAAAAPLTVIGGDGLLAIADGPGPAAPVGFLVAGFLLLLFAVGFVTMTPFVPEAGAFFSYINVGLGARWGLGAAFTALVTYTAIQVGMYGYMGWALNDLIVFYGGPSLPWWFWAFSILLLVGVLGYRNIELSSKVLGLALILEIAVVVILDAVVFIRGGKEGISGTSFSLDAISSGPLGIAVLFAFAGFMGFEATAVFRDEARTPDRTIPRATYLSVAVVGVFYTISCWAVVEAWGPSNVKEVVSQSLATDGNALLDTAELYVGSTFRDFMQILLVTSLFACILSFHNVISRYQFNLAGNGLLPKALANVHPTEKSPHISSLLQSATALILIVVLAGAGLDPLVGVFASMAGISTVGMILLLILTSISVLNFFRRNATARDGRMVTTYVVPTLSTIGMCAAMYLVLSNFTMVTDKSLLVSAMLAAVPVVALVVGLRGRRSSRLVAASSAEDSARND